MSWGRSRVPVMQECRLGSIHLWRMLASEPSFDARDGEIFTLSARFVGFGARSREKSVRCGIVALSV